ncbi:MAG: transposase, partial [Balneolaceae bacterium]|nr:transposase [Balneolaceae bacterium]
MSEKITAFYRGNTQVSVDFSAEGVSSDGAVVLLEKLERKHKLISCISEALPDRRDPAKLTHSVEKLLRQRVFLLMQGYEDCNDAEHLNADPLFEDILGGPMAS